MTSNIWETCVFVQGISRTECASWVQAIGSILALVVAVGVGWFQAHRTRQMALAAILHAERAHEIEKKEKIIEAYAPAMAISQRAIFVFMRFVSDLEVVQASRADPPPAVVFPAEAGLLVNSFGSIAAHELPTYPGVLAVLKIRHELFELHRLSAASATRSNAHMTLPAQELQSLHAAIGQLEAAHEDLRAELIRAADPNEDG